MFKSLSFLFIVMILLQPNIVKTIWENTFILFINGWNFPSDLTQVKSEYFDRVVGFHDSIQNIRPKDIDRNA